MKHFEDKNIGLGFFGEEYELKVLNLIIGSKEVKGNGVVRDDSFGRKIINKLSSEHFTNTLAQRLVVSMKNHYKVNNKIPYYDTIKERILANAQNEYDRELFIEYLRDIQKSHIEEPKWVKDNLVNFINSKNVFSCLDEIKALVIQGKYEKFNEIPTLLQRNIISDVDENPLEAFVPGDYRHLEEGERHPIPTKISALDSDMNGGLAYGEFALFIAPSGAGKAQPHFCKIYTPNGYKTFSEIKIGDEILGSDGKCQKVLGVYSQGKKEYYKVSFTDNTYTYCCKDHLWNVKTKDDITHKKETYRTYSLEKIMENYKTGSGASNYRIPRIPFADFNNTDNLDIHPYLLGVLIGDGSLCGNFGISNGDQQLLDKVIEILGEEYELVKRNKYDYRIKDKNKHKANRLKNLVEAEGLLGKKSYEKFIPKKYLFASYENRLELIRGLIDTDGYIGKKGKITFTSTSKNLAEEFRFLVLSVGGYSGQILEKQKFYTHKGEKKRGRISYDVCVSFNDDIKLVSYITRKQSRYIPRDHYKNNKSIKNISLEGVDECICIKVSNEDQLYVTDDFILTHNTTFSTYVSNNAAKDGYNVLQIFFEDTEEQIKMKHVAKLIGKPINFSSNKKNRKVVIKETDDKLRKISEKGGSLVLHSMDSTETTVEDIKNLYIRAQEQGVYFPDTGEYRKIKFDLVIIDYLDCIKPKKNYSSVWEGQSEIARDLEKLCGKDQLNFACWCFTQGTKASLNAKLVTGEQMGGDFGKYKVAHFVASLARTLEQQSMCKATFSILKSRFGRSGIIYQDCIFDNANLIIEMEKEEFLTDKVVNDILVGATDED